ncbi:MAG TPA: hypothetical protein VK538_12060 [Solirubrobacteraceae bacterium]|nr:hypothetical protein [Solirubrobacteraceae bacterium]
MARSIRGAGICVATGTGTFNSSIETAGVPEDQASRRPATSRLLLVIYRKLSLGSQSEGGEQRTARLLSAHTTCRLQQRSLFVYLADALSAHARGDPVPSLA